MAASRHHEFTAATMADCTELGERMRAEERLEVGRSLGVTPYEAVVFSVGMSAEAWALRLNGELAGVFGVAGVHPHGFVWMLTTDTVDRLPKAFWVACVDGLEVLLRRWGELGNWVDADYSKALRWAKRLGFEVSDPAPYGASGALFCYIEKRKGA